jgi:Flp pilus assembly pilin Flp
MEILKRFVSDERGTEVVEWGIMAGLIVVGIIAAVATIGGWVEERITGLADAL